MYILRDSFNDRDISKHRTLLAAMQARSKHSRAVERANGKGSFVTYSILDHDGMRPSIDEEESAMHELHMLQCRR